MQQVFGFVEFYVSPFIFALGLVCFFYGVINYFVIGPSFEEERRELGRRGLLWSTFLFLIGLVVLSVTHWVFSISTEIKEKINVETGSELDTLHVPNVPEV